MVGNTPEHLAFERAQRSKNGLGKQKGVQFEATQRAIAQGELQRGTKQFGESRKRIIAFSSRIEKCDESVWRELLEVSIDEKRLMLQALSSDTTLGRAT